MWQKLYQFLRKHLNVLLVLLLIILNVILKSLYLGSQEIDIDEPFSIYHSQANISEIFRMLPNENNPPLFFILLHFWIKLFGASTIAVRSLPMIFSSLAVVFVYGIGKVNYSRIIGLGAALIYTFSNLNMFHAHDTRVYSLFVLLAVMSMYYFFLYIKNVKINYLILFSVANVLLIYSHFFGFFILILQAVCILTINELRKNIFKKFLLSILIEFIAYLPYLYIFITRFLLSSGGTWVPRPDFSSLYGRLWMFSNGPENMVFFCIILFIAIVLLVYRKEKPTTPTLIIFIWFAGLYLFMFFISFKIPMFIDKYLIYLTPGYYLCIAVAALIIGGQRKIISYLVLASCVFIMAKKTNLDMENGRKPSEVVKLVKSYQSENTPVYICPPWIELNLSYYYDINAFNDYGNVRTRLNDQNVYPISSAGEIDFSVFDSTKTAIYIDGWSTLTDPDSSIYKTLRNQFRIEELIGDFNGYGVYFYSKE
jgi:uncharacterized membrane protein